MKETMKRYHRDTLLRRTRCRTSQGAARRRRTAVYVARTPQPGEYIRATAKALHERQTALLRECVGMLLEVRAGMCERGELAGRIVSHLENSRT